MISNLVCNCCQIGVELHTRGVNRSGYNGLVYQVQHLAIVVLDAWSMTWSGEHWMFSRCNLVKNLRSSSRLGCATVFRHGRFSSLTNWHRLWCCCVDCGWSDPFRHAQSEPVKRGYSADTKTISKYSYTWAHNLHEYGMVYYVRGSSSDGWVAMVTRSR